MKLKVRTNVDLAQYSTMKLGGTATAVVEVTSVFMLAEAVQWAHLHGLPIFTIGRGSNVIFKGNYNGLIIVNRILGFEILSRHADALKIRVGAGENWDDIVLKTIKMGLSGIEKLSLIPGTAGATPVQNVGAYGTEIADVLIDLEAFDIERGKTITLKNAQCEFGYRNSMFKSVENRRYIITSITIKLSTRPPQPPFFDVLEKALEDYDHNLLTAGLIRQAVIGLRQKILPDPKKLPNSGSFFKNPIIQQNKFEILHAKYSNIAHWPTPDGHVKVHAGWLIDQAGLRGHKTHGIRIYKDNPKVFINESATSYADLRSAQLEVVNKVRKKLGITLESEPDVV